MDSKEIIASLSKALINWYNYKEGSRALFISGGFPECEVLFDVLLEKKLKTDIATLGDIDELDGKYDYIVMAGIVEKSNSPEHLFLTLRKLLKSTGKMLIATDNRFAIRYFCGEKDILSGHVFDGIDNYRRVSAKRMEEVGGHSYSKSELRVAMQKAGFESFQFFSVMPTIQRPQVLLKEGYIPNERLDIRVFPQYKSPQTIFLEEETLYESLLENDMFHQMANGYLIECIADGVLTDANQITIQGDRSPKEAFATILRENQVLKRPLYHEGIQKVELLMRNTEYLSEHGVPMIPGKIQNDTYITPFVKGEIATNYFRNLLRKSKSEFLEKLEEYWQLILNSSEHVAYDKVNWKEFEPGWEKRKADDPNIDKWEKLSQGNKKEKENIGVILKKGFVDLVSLNCFHTEEGFKFFDQEFYIVKFPANAILLRTIDFIYRDCRQMEKLYPKEELLKHFHLFEHQDIWRRKVSAFLGTLRSEKELQTYHKCVRRDYQTMNANRFRMDYTQEEYDRLFNHIFDGVDHKRIFLFGSGRYSEQFIEKFYNYYEITGIIDNNQERWGSALHGIPIMGPEELTKQDSALKVFVCIKFYEDVLKQLKELGIGDISIFDPRLEYRRPMKISVEKKDEVPKRYHIGYVAGVFDLFHIGHLNLLRRAKELCDYLIVGVVTDEQVIKSKKTRPYISFSERLEIVQSCKYVDEAVEIPVDNPSTESAYRRYHFDVQFSGSDYENDPGWLAKREFLRQHGSDLVFFPYTESVSSTKLKSEIRDNLK